MWLHLGRASSFRIPKIDLMIPPEEEKNLMDWLSKSVIITMRGDLNHGFQFRNGNGGFFGNYL